MKFKGNIKHEILLIQKEIFYYGDIDYNYYV